MGVTRIPVGVLKTSRLQTDHRFTGHEERPWVATEGAQNGGASVSLSNGHLLALYTEILRQHGLDSPQAEEFRHGRRNDELFRRQAEVVGELFRRRCLFGGGNPPSSLCPAPRPG